MAKAKIRHLYYDQQKPDVEPEDAEHSNATPAMFAAHEPTPEDEYFLKEARVKSAERKFRTVTPPTSQPESDQPKGVWQRLLRALDRRANKGWRP